jgi:hypothetical protein
MPALENKAYVDRGGGDSNGRQQKEGYETIDRDLEVRAFTGRRRSA